MVKKLDIIPAFNGGYYGLVESFPANIVMYKNVGEYDMDMAYLLNDDEGNWGFLIHGYGSCSGCDEYEGCDNDPAKLLDLRERMFNWTKWFDNKAELLNYLNSVDWELKVECYFKGFVEFLDEVKEYLGYNKAMTPIYNDILAQVDFTYKDMVVDIILEERNINEAEAMTSKVLATRTGLPDVMGYLSNNFNFAEWKTIIPLTKAMDMVFVDGVERVEFAVKWNKMIALIARKVK